DFEPATQGVPQIGEADLATVRPVDMHNMGEKLGWYWQGAPAPGVNLKPGFGLGRIEGDQGQGHRLTARALRLQPDASRSWPLVVTVVPAVRFWVTPWDAPAAWLDFVGMTHIETGDLTYAIRLPARRITDTFGIQGRHVFDLFLAIA